MDAVLEHKFEFTYELAWKSGTAKRELQGLNDATSLKSVYRVMYTQKWIDHEALWLEMIKDRNLTSHV